MTFREHAAIRIFALLMERQGNDQDEYPELACEYAEDLAKAACERWGHVVPERPGGVVSFFFDVEVVSYVCVRCGTRREK